MESFHIVRINVKKNQFFNISLEEFGDEVPLLQFILLFSWMFEFPL